MAPHNRRKADLARVAVPPARALFPEPAARCAVDPPPHFRYSLATQKNPPRHVKPTSGRPNKTCSMTKKLFISIAILALAIGGYFAYPYISFFTDMGFDAAKERLNRLPFDSAEWKAGQENDIRIRMVDSLLRNYELRGKTRVEILALLGEPDNTGYFREYDLVYRLGAERGFISIDSEWLVFRLDTNDTVKECKIARD